MGIWANIVFKHIVVVYRIYIILYCYNQIVSVSKPLLVDHNMFVFLYSLVGLRAFLPQEALLKFVPLDEHKQTQSQERKNHEEKYKQPIPCGGIFIWARETI